MTTYLIDLASYQHGINLAAVKAAGFTRVNVKLSEGTDATVNPDAGAWIDQASSLGLDICTFHWLNGSHSGADQAAVALGQMKRFGVQYGTAHQVDCEDVNHPATWAIWRDYVNAMQDGLGRHVINYTGDWWWKPRMGSNNGAALTPYLWAAPNAGYRTSYPGDTSADWHAGYGGWGDYSALQYAVSPIAGAGGGNLSKTAWRDPKVWSALTGVDAATTEGFLMTLSDDKQQRMFDILDGLAWGKLALDGTKGPDGKPLPICPSIWERDREQREAAMAAQLTALTAAVTKMATSGTSIDTQALLAAIAQAGQTESAAVKALQAQVADLQAKLAAAGHALGS